MAVEANAPKMTLDQQTTLALIKKVNAAEFDGWFSPSEVMAFVQVESAFHANAHRYEPRLNESSFGLMQVLASTARSVEPRTTATEMFNAETGLRIGMKVAKLYWDQETEHFGREPAYEEWAAAFNEGVGGAERDVAAGREPDPAYTTVWIAAQQHWMAQGVDA